MNINIINTNDLLWNTAITYLENCPWRGTQFLLDQIHRGTFDDWERLVVARNEGEIAGFCAVCKRDWIPDVLYTPFITSLYVAEAFRGNRLSQRLIEAANQYVRTLGFDAVYLFSDHIGLYEKYGFSAIDKYSTPWGEQETLFCRTLSPLSFRKMQKSDLVSLTQLLLIPSIAKSLHWHPSPDEIREAYKKYWSCDPDGANYMMILADSLVGWIKLNGLLEKNTLWISMLVIHPDHQGKHYGKIALRWVEQYAKEKAYPCVGIQTTVDNCAAVALYLKAGYRMDFAKPDGDRYVFTKDISYSNEQ